MKIAINGTSRGLGKVLLDRLGRDHDVVGFNRPEYALPDKINELADAVAQGGFDVFVNNVFVRTAKTPILYEHAQLPMLYAMLSRWHDDPSKTIINIGSRITIQATNADWPQELVVYQSLKKEQDRFCRQVTEYQDHRCRMINVQPAGLTGSPYANPDSHVNPVEVAQTIDWLLRAPATCYVGSVLVMPPK